eukprot:12885919-Prorocentrum_lima.AAC.1
MNLSCPPRAGIPTSCPLLCAARQVLNIFSASSAVLAIPGSLTHIVQLCNSSCPPWCNSLPHSI